MCVCACILAAMAHIQRLWHSVDVPLLQYDGMHRDAKELYKTMAGEGVKQKMQAVGREVVTSKGLKALYRPSVMRV